MEEVVEATKEEEEEVSMTIPLKSHISDYQFYISFFCPIDRIVN